MWELWTIWKYLQGYKSCGWEKSLLFVSSKWETFPEKIAADILKEVKKSIFTTDKDSRAIQESIMKVLKESNIERG